MNLYFINCIKITDNLGKITIYYYFDFKKIKIHEMNECDHIKRENNDRKVRGDLLQS